MAPRLSRPGVLSRSSRSLVSACGGSTTSTSPPVERGGPSVAPSEAAVASRRPARAGDASRPAAPVEIRWYCCLGGGEATRAEDVRGQGRRRLQRLAPEHPPHLRGRDLRAAANGRSRPSSSPATARTSSARSASAARTRSRASGSTSPRSSRRTTTTCRASRRSVVDIYKLDEGQVGIPFAIYPSALFYQKDMFEEAGLNEPPHKYGDQYKMPDGSDGRLDLRHGPQDRKQLDRRQERQERDRSRLRPEEDRPVGLRAPARRPAGHGRRTSGPASCSRHGRQDGPDPGRLGGRLEVLLPVDPHRPHGHDRRPVPEQGHQPQRLPVLHGQRRDERELPVVDLRPQ